MTESEKAVDNGESDIPSAKIKRQVEYYFSDFNLVRDKFLQEQVKQDDGWVTVEVLLTFQRLAKLCNDSKAILSCLKNSQSSLLEVDEENGKVRRVPTKPLPDDSNAYRTGLSKCTVYCKGFDKENSTLDDLLVFYDKFDNVINVQMRTWHENKDRSKKHFKGSVFVTFADRESAEKFMSLADVKGPQDQELIRKWQEDYFQEKKVEMEERKSKSRANRINAKQVKQAVQKADKEPEKIDLPKGAVLRLAGLGETVMRETIKTALDEQFGVKSDTIAFIYYEKGNEKALLRFKVESAAKDLVEKINKSLSEEGKAFQINGADVTFDHLEGDEETEFLKKCLEDMKEMKNRSKGHKRRCGGNAGPGHKKFRK